MITRYIALWIMFTLFVATPLSRLAERVYPSIIKPYKLFLQTQLAIHG